MSRTPNPWQTKASLRVLSALEEGVKTGKFRRTDTAEALDLAPSTVQAHLNKLEAGGLVELDDRNPPTITTKGLVFLSLFKRGKIR